MRTTTHTSADVARKAASATHMVLRKREAIRANEYKQQVLNEIKENEKVEGMCSDTTFYAGCVIIASCVFLITVIAMTM